MSTEQAEDNKPLPEVPLKWKDFAVSLEKLRHKPYGKKTRERDWFRINPLEMILLGCQSICCKDEARREYGTMILVMEDLTLYMRHRPRFWLNLLTVLEATYTGDTPSSILQRCKSALSGIWSAVERFAQYESMIRGWYCEHLLPLMIKHPLGDDKHVASSEMINLQKCLVDLCDKAKSRWQKMDPGVTSSDDNCMDINHAVHHIAHHLKLQEKDDTMLSVMIKIHLMLESSITSELMISKESFTQLCQRVSSVAEEDGVTLILDILQVLATWHHSKENTEIKTEEDNIINTLEQDESSATTDTEKQPTVFEEAVSLFETIDKALINWESYGYDKRDVFIGILELALVMLSHDQLEVSLPTTKEFFNQFLSVLMTYATEGYLSTNAKGIMCELLKFICSVIENGNSANDAILSLLPNLFGPVFGVKNHAVSCKLLEYGYLAVCSQHRKSLLTEGLRFLVDLYHMFIPIDNIRAQQIDQYRHIEAWTIAEDIVNSILDKIVLTEDMPSSEDSNALSSDAVENQEENILESVMEEELVPLSDSARNEDKTIRLTILQKLLELACAMIRNGDNIAYLYASVLPKLFHYSPPPEAPKHFNKEKLAKIFGEEPSANASISTRWKLDKKRFAVQLLNLTILAQDKDASSPFQICGIVVPKLIKNLEKMEFSDEAIMKLALDILQITYETLEAGHSIEELLSHGIDLMSYILPNDSSEAELRQLISQMASHFATSTNSSMLFLTKSSCEFMCKSFPNEIGEIQQLFKTVLFKGRRNEIRMLFRVCHQPLLDCSFTDLHCYFYEYSSGHMTSRQLIALCELLLTMMDIEKLDKTNKRIVQDGQEDGPTEVTTNMELESQQLKQVVQKLLQPCVLNLRTSLHEKRFKKETWEPLSKQLSHVSLFCVLFDDEMPSLVDYTVEDLEKTFKSKFAPDILHDESTMDLLTLCAKRIEHMQFPRYQSLKALLRDLLKHFLTVEVDCEGDKEDQKKVMSSRLEKFDAHINSIARNSEDLSHLHAAGYSPTLWTEKLIIPVDTDGRCSLEENMRQTLLACFREYVNILTQMAFTHVSVDGETIKVTELFDELLTLTELKGRRAIAVKLIDQRLGKAHEGHFYEKKLALLAKEDEIEADFEKQAKIPVKPKHFRVALNTNFFDCAKCCGAQIVGCYAPNGEHCERPLEIGLRCDSAIASIYHEANMEIENCEILFTQEGAYIFKAYTNGHPYDTSQVWVAFFSELLKEPLVPAVIIPHYYPNNQTWELLRRCVQTELTGSVLTCRPDFSPEWRTYYDHKPERIKCGEDIVLHPGFALSEDGQAKPTLQRQKSILSKDLAGMIFGDVFQEMQSDEWLSQFRFLGKFISQYISVYIQQGSRSKEVIFDGFDYERWKKAYLKSHNKQPPEKQAIVNNLVEFLDGNIWKWCIDADLNELWQDHSRQFLEMKIFLEKLHNKEDNDFKFKHLLLKDVKRILSCHTVIVPIFQLPEALQEEIMHWIFRNEDRVWRYRGGRDGRETLQQFMGFLGRTKPGGGNSANKIHRNCFPGVIVFKLPPGTVSLEEMNPKVDDLVAYAVGEMCSPLTDKNDEESLEDNRWHPTTWNTYEVVTAWVHPSYRGLNLAVRMYFDISLQAPSSFVMCDMLSGSVERIVSSSWLLLFLERVRILKWIVQRRQKSYHIHTQIGGSEQFEQVVFRIFPIRIALHSQRALYYVQNRVTKPVVTLGVLIIATICGVWWHYKR